MRPVYRLSSSMNRALLVTGLVGCAVVVVLCGAVVTHAKNLAKHNLFSLVGTLNQTTGTILQNTKALNQQVDTVENKLSQLSTQETIMQKQVQTGGELQSQLSTQIRLTTQNVNLMSQILQSEKTALTATNQVQHQSDALEGQIGENAAVLKGLLQTLGNINASSASLNDKMNGLMTELTSAKQEFRLFGQVNQLLGAPSSPLGSVPSVLGGSSLGNTLGNTLGTATGSQSSPSGNASSANNSTSTSATNSGQTAGGTLGNALGGATNGVSSLGSLFGGN